MSSKLPFIKFAVVITFFLGLYLTVGAQVKKVEAFSTLGTITSWSFPSCTQTTVVWTRATPNSEILQQTVASHFNDGTTNWQQQNVVSATATSTTFNNVNGTQYTYWLGQQSSISGYQWSSTGPTITQGCPAYSQAGYYAQSYYQAGYYAQSYYQSYYQASYYAQSYYQSYYQASYNNPPNIPTQVSPSNGTGTVGNWVNNNPTFGATVSDPDGNNVRGYFNFLTVSGNPAVPADQNGSTVVSGGTSTWTSPSTLSDGKYDWRVLAIDSLGASSSYTGYWRVKKDSVAPGSVGCGSPTVAGTTITVPNMTATDPTSTGTPSGVATIRLDESTNGGASWTNGVDTRSGSATGTGQEYNATLTTNSASLTSRTEGTTYTYRVVATDGAGNPSGAVNCGSVLVPVTPNYTLGWGGVSNPAINAGSFADYTVVVTPQCSPSWVGNLVVTIGVPSITPAEPKITSTLQSGSSSVTISCPATSGSVIYRLTTDPTITRGNVYSPVRFTGTSSAGNRTLDGSLTINEGQWLQTRLGDFYSTGNVSFNPGPPSGKYSSDYLLQVGGTNTGGVSSLAWYSNSYSSIGSPAPSYSTFYLQAGGSNITTLANCAFNDSTKPTSAGVFRCNTGNQTIGMVKNPSLLAKSSNLVNQWARDLQKIPANLEKFFAKNLKSVWEFATNPLVTKVLATGPGAFGTALGSAAPISTGNTWDYTMGYSFVPSSNGQITSLGGYFSGTKTVTLWNSGGTQLASQSVTCSNSWCNTAITPVSVSSGQTYWVGVYLAGSGGAYFGATTPQTATGITMTGGYYQTGNANLALSNQGLINGTWYGIADVVFTAGSTGSPVLGTLFSSTAPSLSNQAWNYTMGWSFTVSSNGQITGLGGYFSGTKTVTVWNSAGTQLTSQSVTCSNTWCRTNLASPLSVTTGVTYYVGVYVNSSGGAYFSSFAPQTASGVTALGGWYQTGNVNLPLSNPINSGGGFYGAPDIVFAPSASANVYASSLVLKSGDCNTGTATTTFGNGTTVNLCGTIGNNGTGSTGTSFTMTGYRNRQTQPAYGTAGENSGTPGPWTAGASYPNQTLASFAANSSICTTCYAAVFMDSGNVVSETNESDNFFSLAYTVTNGPTVTTNAANPVSDTQATLNASINPNGSNTNGFFKWGSGTGYASCSAVPTQTSSQALGSGSSATPITQGLSGLIPNTTYSFCAGATSTSTNYGGILTFLTAPSSPTGLQPSGTTTPGVKNITWNVSTGATTYYIRIDDTGDVWNPPVCDNSTTPSTGDVCQNTAGTSYTYNFIAGHSYSIWVHAANSGGTSNPPTSVSVTTGAVVATPTTLFVNGDLTINDNLSYDSNKMVAIFVNGQIKIKSTVTTINAYLYAENGITTSYDTTAKVSPLVINGGVIIGNGANGLPVVVSFNRNVNNATTTGAEQIYYDPRILSALVTSPNDTSFGGTGTVFTEVNP